MNKSKIVQALKHLGLGDKEANVYLAALQLGSATVAEVAAEAGVKRTSVYNFADDLVSAGFLSKLTRNGEIILTAEEPTSLEKKAEAELADIRRVMPDLQGLVDRSATRSGARFYKGIAGLRKVYGETLRSKEPIYAFSDFEKMMPLMGRWLWRYADARAERGISFFCIAKKGPWAQKVAALSQKQRRQIKMARIDLSTEINIYGNSIAILSFERPYTSVIIEDAAIARTMRSIWEFMWGALPQDKG